MATGLEGTLTPEGVRTPEEALAAMEALRAAQANALALQREQATTAARQAAEQYAGLAQAPPPDIAPIAALLNAIQGNVSSVIGQDRGFAQRAEQRTEASRAQLLKQRADTMQAQRDVFRQRAEEAQRVGNLEEQEKYNAKMLLLDKQFDLVSANQKRSEAKEKEEREAKEKREAATLAHQRKLEEIRVRETEQRKGASSADAKEFENMLRGLPTLSQFNDDKRLLIGQLAPKNLRKLGFEATINNITQVRGMARQRLRSDRTPGQMIGRLRAYNREVAALDFKRRSGAMWGSKAKEAPDPQLTEAEIAQAVKDAFAPGEVEAWLAARK